MPIFFFLPFVHALWYIGTQVEMQTGMLDKFKEGGILSLLLLLLLPLLLSTTFEIQVVCESSLLWFFSC